MTPKISVVTATRNAVQHLPALAEFLLRQPSGLVEWIVVDGLSVDGTVQFLDAIRDPKISWTSEPDCGIYDAWNKAISRARGQWIMFVGADDRLGEGWLEACAAAPDVDLVYGGLEIRGPNGDSWANVDAESWDIVRPQMKIRMMLPHPGLAHNRALFSSGRFDTSFRIAGDFHFLAGANIQSGLQLPMTQAVMQFGGVSNRPDMVSVGYRETLRVLHQHGLTMPFSDRMRWLVKRGFAAIAPRLYVSLQSVYWRLRQRL